VGYPRLKRYLLVVLIASLVAAAIVGAGIFVVGSTGDLEARALLTVLLMGFFSLTGLCASLRFERGLAWLGWLGVLVSAAGLVYSELLVWEAIAVEGFDQIKPALALGVAAAALAYTSLLLLARGPYRSVNGAVWLTMVIVLAISGSLVALIITEIEPPDTATRALGAAAVVAVLGTMLAPLLRKVLTLGEESAAARAPAPGPPQPAGLPTRRTGKGRHRAKGADRRPEAKGV
jgi:hypothetical protein